MVFGLKINETHPKRGFLRCLLSVSLWWGIPMVCVELIGVPKQYWFWVIVLALPVTAVGVIAQTLIERAAVTVAGSQLDRSKPDSAKR
jgi:hypothetical protein